MQHLSQVNLNRDVKSSARTTAMPAKLCAATVRRPSAVVTRRRAQLDNECSADSLRFAIRELPRNERRRFPIDDVAARVEEFIPIHPSRIRSRAISAPGRVLLDPTSASTVPPGAAGKILGAVTLSVAAIEVVAELADALASEAGAPWEREGSIPSGLDR
jgi:hypothetical protein